MSRILCCHRLQGNEFKYLLKRYGLTVIFCYSTSSQKPGDELLANFRQQFPEVVAATSSAPNAGTVVGTGASSGVDALKVENDTVNAPPHERYALLKVILERNGSIVDMCF